jgi:hypothetical protein
MGYVYSGVDELAKGDTPIAGSGECRPHQGIRSGLKGRSTSTWRAGAWVMEAGSSLRRGTAIATFDRDGRFPQHRTGQHAALVSRVMASGIWGVDQWRTKGDKISKRLIRRPPPSQRRNADGSFPDASNNALALRVIE